MIYWELIKKFWPFALALVLFGAGYGYGHHSAAVAGKAKLDALQHDYDTFKTEVAAKGEAAQKAAEAAEKAYQVNKEKADNDYQITLARLTDDNRKLRDKDHSRGSFVPKAASTPADPDTACFKRTELELAIGQFVADVQTIAGKGDESIIALNSVKEWAQH